jgi:uncharacterized protein
MGCIYFDPIFSIVLQMIIKYTNFSDGVHEFTLSDSVKKLKLEELFYGDVIVNCKMDKSPHQIVLECNVLLNAKMTCDRCNRELNSEITCRFQLSYLFSKNPIVSDDYNVKYISPEQDKINISDDVYEYAEISIPMKKLCKEDCKGLCLQCGINLNDGKCDCKQEKINDRWEPLQKLWKNIPAGENNFNN